MLQLSVDKRSPSSAWRQWEHSPGNGDWMEMDLVQYNRPLGRAGPRLWCRISADVPLLPWDGERWISIIPSGCGRSREDPVSIPLVPELQSKVGPASQGTALSPAEHPWGTHR